MNIKLFSLSTLDMYRLMDINYDTVIDKTVKIVIIDIEILAGIIWSKTSLIQGQINWLYNIYRCLYKMLKNAN